MILFGSKAQRQALDSLVSAVDSSLRLTGFQKHGNWSWRREVPWRIDEIDLVVRGGTAKHVLPSFRVMLPRAQPSELGERFQHIAQVNVARLLRPNGGPEFDTVVPSSIFGQKRFISSVVADIENAISWFEQFSTPEGCKACLVKYLKPDCPAHLDAVRFLASLPGR